MVCDEVHNAILQQMFTFFHGLPISISTVSISMAIITILGVKRVTTTLFDKIILSNLHFSLGFRRLHNNTAIMAAMMSKTIDAMTMVIMMTILDPPIVFNRPTPEKQRISIRL